MLDGVEQQLVEDHHQRGGDLRRQHAEAAPPSHADAHLGRRDLRRRAGHPVDDAVELDRLVAGHGERLVHQGDGRDPPDRLLQRDPGLRHGHPAGLQPQQRGDGLEVVLHPVVDLPDGGVLGDQGSVPATDLGDVPHEHQRADRHAGGHQRQCPGEHRGTAGVDLPSGWRLTAQRGQDAVRGLGAVQRVTGQPAVQRGQVFAHQVGGVAQSAVRGLRVRAGVGDLAAGVEPDQAVADPGRGGGLARMPGRREGAVRDHLRQVVGGGQVVEFQLAGGARGGEVGVPPHHGDHLTGLPLGGPQPDRDRLVPGRHVAVPDRVALPPDPALGVRDAQVGHLRPADDAPHLVVLVGGGCGGRPDLGDAEERAVGVDRHPEQQVSEGQIGEQLPVAGDPVEVVDVGRTEVGVLLGEVAQRGHGDQGATPRLTSSR